MRLLLLCPHFEPDLHAATGEVMSRLVHALADRGHQIDVVTSLPWYKDHAVDPAWTGRPVRTETTDFGSIVRVYPFPTDKNDLVARAAGFVGFTGLLTACSLKRPRPDVVMAMSPPIFLGEAGWLAATRYRAPFVFNVQDIFPDVAVDLGALTNPKVIAAARRYERSLYRRADAVTVLSEDQAANVRAKLDGDPDGRVAIIKNFVDPDRVRVIEGDTDYRRAHGLDGKTVVMYSGNVGLSQAFDLVKSASDHFADRPEVHFVINGEGAGRPGVDAWAAERANVTVSDFAPREAVSDVLGSADLHLVLLKRGLARSSTPSKLYGILAAGRPCLAAIDEGSEVTLTLADAGAGVSVPPEDPAAFISALEALLADPARMEAMGRAGRAHLESCLTPAAQAEAYESLFDTLRSKR